MSSLKFVIACRIASPPSRPPDAICQQPIIQHLEPVSSSEAFDMFIHPLKDVWPWLCSYICTQIMPSSLFWSNCPSCEPVVFQGGLSIQIQECRCHANFQLLKKSNLDPYKPANFRPMSKLNNSSKIIWTLTQLMLFFSPSNREN